jgi:hypothetical protein
MDGEEDEDEVNEVSKMLYGNDNKKTAVQTMTAAFEFLSRPLYPGTEKSVLSMSFILLSWARTRRKTIPDVAMVELFRIIAILLPAGCPIPSFVACKRCLLAIGGIRPVVYDTCPLGCVLFRDEEVRLKRKLSHATQCPECGASRWKDGIANGVPAGRTTVLGLADQLVARKFWKAYETKTDLRKYDGSDAKGVHSIRESTRFQDLIKTLPHFDRDFWHVLGYMTDGMDCFKEQRGSHGFWPHLLKDLNLPPELLSKAGLFILFAISHGPGQPTNMRGVLTLLLEEMEVLWTGKTAYHPLLNITKTVRAVLHLILGDIPGLQKVMEMHAANSLMPCYRCWIKGDHTPLGGGLFDYGKYCRWLQPDNPTHGKFHEHDGLCCPPMRRQSLDVFTIGKEVEARAVPGYGLRKTYKSLIKHTGIKAVPIFAHFPPRTLATQNSDVPTICDYLPNVLYDPAHGMKELVKRILRILSGAKDLSCPTEILGESKLEFKTRVLNWKAAIKKLDDLALTGAEKDRTDMIYSNIMAPGGFRRPNAKPFSQFSNMNIDDQTIFMVTDVGRMCFMWMETCTREPIREFYRMFCAMSLAFQKIWRAPIQLSSKQSKQNLMTQVAEAFCQYQLLFPVSEHQIVQHAWMEITLHVMENGPVHAFSGLGMERYMHLIRTQLHDRAHPETAFINYHGVGISLMNVGGAFRDSLFKGYTAKEKLYLGRFGPHAHFADIVPDKMPKCRTRPGTEKIVIADDDAKLLMALGVLCPPGTQAWRTFKGTIFHVHAFLTFRISL